jgi:hypothetical protein
MKPLILLAALSFATVPAFAGPKDAPFIDSKSSALQKRIENDVASGNLTKTDADELKVGLQRIQRIEDQAQRSGVITPRTRADMRRGLAKLEKDIERR